MRTYIRVRAREHQSVYNNLRACALFGIPARSCVTPLFHNCLLINAKGSRARLSLAYICTQREKNVFVLNAKLIVFNSTSGFMNWIGHQLISFFPPANVFIAHSWHWMEYNSTDGSGIPKTWLICCGSKYVDLMYYYFIIVHLKMKHKDLYLIYILKPEI